MEWAISIVVLLAFGYFIYARVKKNQNKKGSGSKTGGPKYTHPPKSDLK
jgi:hypothetical protein